MVTLGEIISINADTNLCLVKLPTLEGAGNKNKIELHATMMLPPGIDAGYEVGDVVFVSFVDNTLGRPMVLGQLYRGPGKGTKIDKIGKLTDTSLGCAKTVTCNNLVAKDSTKCHNLEATGAVSIPQSTTFVGADADYDTPSDLISKIKTLESKVETLEGKVRTLESKVEFLDASLDRTQTALVALATATAGGFLSDGKFLAAAACQAIGVVLGLGELAADAIQEDKEEESTEENTPQETT